ncbi:MAG: PD-(D/E)XK nuclease family protein, partial [FCB group bacterium]|nr:PD-(D/E)XK nuclease family protein [FCB group bacterium]
MQIAQEEKVPEKYISFSRLELVTQCPAKFKHRYVLESKARADTSSPAVLGSIVHKTLELAYLELQKEGFSGALKPRKDIFLKHLKNVIQSENHPPELFLQAQPMVKDFADNETCHSDSVLAIEKQFVFEPDTLGEITILGYIDRIDKPAPNTISLIDYKTNRMLYTAEELKQSLQASIYIMAAKEIFPDAENIEMRFLMLRHGIQQRTFHTEKDLAEAKEYILLVNEQIRRIESGAEAPAALNKYCPWCEYRHLCETYKNACETDHPLTLEDPNDIQAVAEEYEDISARAKIMYARKEELADLLKMKLIGKDRLQAAGHYYSLGKTTVTNFTDVNRLITLLEKISRIEYPDLLNRIATIGKGKFDELMKSLRLELPET